MDGTSGHIEFERRVDAITIGVRHRKDPGDIAALMRSIEEVGMLQPITITPTGVLVCGWRRLEAVRRLGWRTLKVWVRSGISDELSHLLAQQDENEQRKPLTPLECAHLYAEVKRLMAEEAERRQALTRFGAPEDSGGVNGAAGPAAPRGSGYSRNQASRLITGSKSYARLEQVGWIERVSTDPSRPASVREFAANMLAEIQDGAPVEPAYKRVRAAVELASDPDRSGAAIDEDSASGLDVEEELARLAAESFARVKQAQARKGLHGLKGRPRTATTPRTVRSFVLTWAELENWSTYYEPDELATSLKAEDWDRFERTVAETVSFADRLRAARNALASA